MALSFWDTVKEWMRGGTVSDFSVNLPTLSEEPLGIALARMTPLVEFL
jgi:hypothetical protein